MLMTRSQLRRIIVEAILLEQENEELDQKFDEAVDEMKEFPMEFISKIENAVDQDLDEQPMGDEAVGALIVGAALSGPMIMKALNWIAKQIAKSLEKSGIGKGEDSEIIKWLEEKQHAWHHVYQVVCEKIGECILRLFGNENPSPEHIKNAGNVVFLCVVIIVGTWGFNSLMHALHNHEFWMSCGETLVSCVEYTEVMMLINTIGAAAMGHDIAKHADEHGIEIPSGVPT